MMSELQMQRSPQAERRSSESWVQRYSTAAFAGFCVLVAVAVGWWTGEWDVAVLAAVILGPVALLSYVGGRTGRFRSLRGDHDEREQEHDYRSFAVAGNVLLAVLLVLTMREMLDGNINSTPQWLLTIFGASYALTHVYYWWRDRRA